MSRRTFAPEEKAKMVEKIIFLYEKTSCSFDRIGKNVGIAAATASNWYDEVKGLGKFSKDARKPHPCGCCGRTVAYRYAHQSGGKQRVRHKCPHGTWCRSGDRLEGTHAIDSRCPECKRGMDQKRKEAK